MHADNARANEDRCAIIEHGLAVHRVTAAIGTWRHRLLSQGLKRWERHVLELRRAEELRRHRDLHSSALDLAKVQHNSQLADDRERMRAEVAAAKRSAREQLERCETALLKATKVMEADLRRRIAVQRVATALV